MSRFAKSKKTKSVVYGWITSYVLLMLIVVSLTGVVYWFTNRAIETEINSSNEWLLENIRYSIDNILADISGLSLDLLASQDVQIVSRLDPQDQELYYELYKAAKSLASYKVINNSLISYFIYMKNIDRIITPGVVRFTQTYYDQNIAVTGLPYEEWLEFIGQRSNGKYLLIPYENDTGNRPGAVAHILSIPTALVGKQIVNIVVTLDFSDALVYSNETRYMFILDGNNHVIAQSGNALAIDTEALPVMDKLHGVFVVQGDNGKDVVSYIASRQNDWKFITVTPDDVYWQNSGFIRKIMFGETIMCLVGMILLAWYFVRRNYRFLWEITSFVQNKLNPEAAWEGNEYALIQQALVRSFTQNEKMEDKLDKQEHMLRTNTISSLLGGQDLFVSQDELFAMCGIDFSNPHFAVVAVQIDSVNHEKWTTTGEEINESIQQIQYTILDILEEVLSHKHIACSVNVSGWLLCLVNTYMAEAPFRQSIAADLMYARDFIAQNLDANITLSVSAWHGSFTEIHHAYLEAKSAMAYARKDEKDSIAFFSDMKMAVENAGLYPVELERPLLNYIRLGNGPAAEQALHDYFNSEPITQASSQTNVRFVLLALAATLLRNISANEDDFDQLTEKNRALLADMMNAATPTAMYNPFLKLVSSLSRENSILHRKNSNITDHVQDYLCRHYADSSLTIASLAELVNISPYYASKMFKNQTGISILEYLTRLRVDAAKVLMEDEQLTQEQIAEMVGFTNVRTFQRCFKKIERVSPGKFKNIPRN